MKVAILVDGGFYRKRANYLFGIKSPQDRATELSEYCLSHVKNQKKEKAVLYRVFYYDCPPLSGVVFHPLLKKNIQLNRSETYRWATEFFDALKSKRKFALRMGKLSDISIGYTLHKDAIKALFNGKMEVGEIKEKDFVFSAEQKGVDMKIGLDIASMAYKQQVDQIVLISGDSDFVPAAKLARREGIDFILDPMWAKIKPDLYEHIDGLRSQCKNQIKQDVALEE